MTHFTFDAIGTFWQIDVYDTLSPDQEAALRTYIIDRIAAFDMVYSRFRADSLVTSMSLHTGVFTMPDDAERLMSLYYDLYLKTNGLFTPLVGNILSDAGYDATYTLVQNKPLVVPPSWEETLEYKHPLVTMKKPAMLDFGAAGKGYLVDLIGELIESEGYRSYCIDAGGDILHRGDSPIRIGLENPTNIEQVIGIYPLANQSICGSAGNRRVWGNFTHIINPHTLTSPRTIAAVWVIADTALLADALATCLFFVSPDILNATYQYEYLIVYEDMSIATSEKYTGEIFT